MKKHHHEFVESYDGLVGFGLDRKTNEDTVIVYLQKFADDELQEFLRGRMSDQDLEALFDLVSRILRDRLTEEEYHAYFLK